MKRFLPSHWLCFAALIIGIRSGDAQGKDVPRLTRAPYIQWTTPTSAYLVWNTDKPSSSAVEVMSPLVRPIGQRRVVTAPARVVQHIIKLSGLKPGTTYSYQVSSDGVVLKSGQFQTAKLPSQPFHFAVWGDSGAGSTGQKRLAVQIEKDHPDFLVHTGDLIYEHGEASKYDPNFFRIYAPILARVPFYGCLGNHDTDTRNGQPFFDNFVLPRNGPPGLTPERNYSFDYASAHFVVLDTNQSEETLRRVVAPWLENDLRRSRALWKFAVFHQPVYSSGPHGDEPCCKRVLAPIFSRQKVDVVFNGHDHDYERFKPQGGVVYIVTGEGGANRYKRKSVRPITAFYSNSDWSFTRIAINGRTLQGQQISTTGAVIDRWSLHK
ncbi:MAG: metallophosphoesterase [Abitibacteriaceae bacterium]|nr:metallophosphoesterase [Abditibacteriaceae bacterium]